MQSQNNITTTKQQIIETNEKTGEYDKIIENNKRFVEEELNYDEILKYTYLIIKEICCQERTHLKKRTRVRERR